MSTRAVYVFVDELGRFPVYKHADGYPRGAHEFIKAAIPLAWEFPRFEACEFAASFIAANKTKRGGGVYLTEGPDFHGDLAYWYEIGFNGNELTVKIMRRDWSSTGQAFKEIFSGTLEEMGEFEEKDEE